MSNATAMDSDAWATMRRQIAWLRAVLGLVLIAMVASGSAWLFSRDDVLRTRGVVIVDAEGRDRILIGAPVPVSADRQRKNAETAAVVLLSPDGADRLIFGEAPGPARDGKSGKRIAESMGLTLHDPKGNERGGIGFLDNGRAVVVLDRASPSTDAVGMMVDDASDFAGMLIAYPAQEKGWALKLGTTGREMAVEVYDPKSAMRGELKLDGSEAAAWKFSPVPAQP